MIFDKYKITADCAIIISFIILSCLPHIYSRMPISSWILLMLILLICVIQAVKNKLWVNRTIVLWWIYLFTIVLGCLYTNDISYAVGYVIKVFVLVLSLSYLTKSINFNNLRKVFEIINFVSVASIVAELFFPKIVSSIRNVLLTNSFNTTFVSTASIEEKIAAFSSKYGIFSDTAVGAFYCAVGLSIGLYFLTYDKSKKVFAYVWLAMSVFGIILTNKRGPMLSVVFASVFLFLIKSSYSRSKKIKAFIVLIVLCGAVYYLFNTNEILINWLARINSNIHSTRSRANIYAALWDFYLQHPIIGNGTKSTRILLGGLDGHNIYLAALSENGTIGTIVFIAALVSTMLDTIKIFKQAQQSQNKQAEATILFCLFVQLYICCYGMTGNPFSNLFSLTMYFMTAGIPIILERVYKLEWTKMNISERNITKEDEGRA